MTVTPLQTPQDTNETQAPQESPLADITPTPAPDQKIISGERRAAVETTLSSLPTLEELLANLPANAVRVHRQHTDQQEVGVEVHLGTNQPGRGQGWDFSRDLETVLQAHQFNGKKANVISKDPSDVDNYGRVITRNATTQVVVVRTNEGSLAYITIGGEAVTSLQKVELGRSPAGQPSVLFDPASTITIRSTVIAKKEPNA